MVIFFSGKSNYIDDYMVLKRLFNKGLVIAYDSKTVDSTGVYTLKGFESFVIKQE